MKTEEKIKIQIDEMGDSHIMTSIDTPLREDAFKLDDDLKSEILSGNYKNFYQFAFDKPLLAGHAFWYYIEERYKRENTTYLLYLARVYKNLNRASQQVTKKRKFKEVLADFMEYEQDNMRKIFPAEKIIRKEVR